MLLLVDVPEKWKNPRASWTRTLFTNVSGTRNGLGTSTRTLDTGDSATLRLRLEPPQQRLTLYSPLSPLSSLLSLLSRLSLCSLYSAWEHHQSLSSWWLYSLALANGHTLDNHGLQVSLSYSPQLQPTETENESTCKSKPWDTNPLCCNRSLGSFISCAIVHSFAPLQEVLPRGEIDLDLKVLSAFSMTRRRRFLTSSACRRLYSHWRKTASANLHCSGTSYWVSGNAKQTGHNRELWH